MNPSLVTVRVLVPAAVVLLCAATGHTETNGTAGAEVLERISAGCLGGETAYYRPPDCVDHPDGYGCDCGPGFHWNTRICMSSAVDSRLEFKQQTPVRYTLLLGKAFPKLVQFTVAFWIKVPDPLLNGTILSYRHGGVDNVLLMRSGPRLEFTIWEQNIDSGITFIPEVWYHVVWTWSSFDSSWTMYLNGWERGHGAGPPSKPIPLGGDFVLGQASISRTTSKFVVTYAFVGELAHLNIWSFVMTSDEAHHIKSSCTLLYCGDAVQWTEFRSGTRGAMRMRWPSGVIQGQCYKEQAGVTCNKHCSDKIGAQCNEEIVENIVWPRTPALNNISIPCPGDGLQDPGDTNNTAFGTRPCYRTDENEGEWGVADIDNCISLSLRKLKYKFQRYLLADYIDEGTLLALGLGLVNHTAATAYTNPVDVATVIDMLHMLVHTQANVIVLRVAQWTDGRQTYARAQQAFPTLEETKQFMEVVSDVVNNLLDAKHELGWNATRPPGVEGDNLMQVIETFAHVLSRSLQYHVTDGHIAGAVGFEQAFLKTARHDIELSVEAQWVERFTGTQFPSHKDAKLGMQSNLGTIELSKTFLTVSNQSDLPAFVKMCSLRLRGMYQILPNHDTRSTGKKAKEDNVNTPVIAMFVHAGDGDLVSNLSTPITYRLPYLNTFNISNPECVRLEHGTIIGGRITRWRWTRDSCELREDNGHEGVCACSVSGVFAITTDMYNDNWNKGEVRPILMNFASYIGCCASSIMCLATCLLHVYYKTSSSTAALHKQLGISVVLGQVVFMVGIDRYEHKMLCHMFAIALHYCFLANYSWLMNEAFNLYIVITYSSHAHDGHSDSGSLLRYYILGWSTYIALYITCTL